MLRICTYVRPFFVSVIMLFVVSEYSPAQEIFPASELTFETIFGKRGGDTGTVYSLLGAGFFRTPRSDQQDSIITAWLADHLNALAVPVSLMQDGSVAMVYIWLTDGDDNLNIHLIRRGVFPGGVMEDAVTVARQMEEMNVPFDEGVVVRRFVSDVEYEAFIEQVIEAEAMAVKEKLGMWIEKSR